MLIAAFVLGFSSFVVFLMAIMLWADETPAGRLTASFYAALALISAYIDYRVQWWAGVSVLIVQAVIMMLWIKAHQLITSLSYIV